MRASTCSSSMVIESTNGSIVIITSTWVRGGWMGTSRRGLKVVCRKLAWMMARDRGGATIVLHGGHGKCKGQ